MQYIMAPLEAHYDDGFGAVGEAFKEGAEILAKESGGRRIFWNHLPELFPLRHAIELFLKSGIIVMHRKLRISYGSEPASTDKPMFLTRSGDWKSLFKSHDLAELYEYWKKLMTENKAKLTESTKYKPDMSVPKELDDWIEKLGVVDPSSDYFRYPVSRNAKADTDKSPFKEDSMESLFPSEAPNEEKVRALVIKNESGEWVRAFKLDEGTHKDISEAAWEAARMLSNFHAMMRIELTDGW
ncbi:MAG: hypothetical protein WA690_09150 [Candidatus Acidiferrales bacterium]